MLETMPSKAYDLKILPQSVKETDSRGHGWCFGLPPGITPIQWPLDRENGFPLKHAFTLLLPEDYRCHGPDIVAVSFFGVSHEHNDGGPVSTDEVVDALKSATPPDDLLLNQLWLADRAAHPRSFRMEDILGCEYVAILLTQAEFDGPFCLPPNYNYPQELYGVPRPHWLDVGSALDFWELEYSPSLDLPKEQYAIFKILGGIPKSSLAFNRAIQWSPRAHDPNVGKMPRDVYKNKMTADGYQSKFYSSDADEYLLHDWAKDFSIMHIGGTMEPIQATPEFSPFYVEFEEVFGGFNFGSGNAQLDLLNMKFDWACG